MIDAAVIGFASVLIAAAAFAAYELSEARRWRQSAAEARLELARQRIVMEEQRDDLELARASAKQHEAEALRVREIAEVELRLLTETKQQMEDKFRHLASDALQTNSQLFLDRSRSQIEHLIEPVNQSLRNFEEQVREIEKSRAGAYQGIMAQVDALTHLQERVRESTDQLKTALRSPSQRGRWGEIQLRRVVELAGMLEYCDFSEQKTLFGETNQRPDLTVRLPNQCQVIVDAKVSLEAYLKSVETTDMAERSRHLLDHARQVRTHIKSLSEKAYWERLPCTPEFVVAFLPLESLFSAAVENDSSLLEFGVSKRVLLATPLTLISLLLTVAHGWRQQAFAENVEKIRETGVELYSRLGTMHGHFSKLGEAIEKTVSAYNSTVGSLERNVFSSARKFRDLRPGNAEAPPEVVGVESLPRKLDESRWHALEPAERS